MDIVGKIILQEYWESDKAAEKPLRKWITVTQQAIWSCFSDVRRTFNHADYYKKGNKKYVIFNIGGNKYRLITAIRYKRKMVVVVIALTHTEYDKGKWKGKL